MSNYKETDVTGSSYVRAHSVNVTNGLTHKSVTFEEERVFNLADGAVVRQPAGDVSESFTPENALTEVPLVNPETGESLGQSATYQDVYVTLYSLYIFLATQRDSGA